MDKGRLHHVMNVCQVIADFRDVLKWPCQDQLQIFADRFPARCGMPVVVGAIDGTHMQIPGPSDHRDAYINRKSYPSKLLPVVCNGELLFWDDITGWPGSVHDSKVFRNGPLKTMLADGNVPPQYHLLGDCVYKLEPIRICLLLKNISTKPTLAHGWKYSELLGF